MRFRRGGHKRTVDQGVEGATIPTEELARTIVAAENSNRLGTTFDLGSVDNVLEARDMEVPVGEERVHSALKALKSARIANDVVHNVGNI